MDLKFQMEFESYNFVCARGCDAYLNTRSFEIIFYLKSAYFVIFCISISEVHVMG